MLLEYMITIFGLLTSKTSFCSSLAITAGSGGSIGTLKLDMYIYYNYIIIHTLDMLSTRMVMA